MKLCTYCGYKNSDDAKFCLRCGSNLSLQPSPWVCGSCGASNVPRSTFCESCGKRISPEAPSEAKPVETGTMGVFASAPAIDEIESDYSERMIRVNGKPFWAGLLMLLGGIVDIGNGIAAFYRTIPSNDLGIDLSGYVAFCGTLVIIFGIGAIVGGFMSITRKHFYMALTGAVFGMLGIGYFYVGAILCFIALIVVAVSKDEFSD